MKRKSKNYQIKVYKKNRAEHLKNDKKVSAMKPGKRKTYTERRENRSDKNKRTRL